MSKLFSFFVSYGHYYIFEKKIPSQLYTKKGIFMDTMVEQKNQKTD